MDITREVSPRSAHGFVRRNELVPEKVLMLAILQDAVICIRDNLGATERKKRQLFVDALDWITTRDSSYLYSFENICDALGFAPSYMRRGFMKLKRNCRQREARGVWQVSLPSGRRHRGS